MGLVETWEEPGVNLTASRLSAELSGTPQNPADPAEPGTRRKLGGTRRKKRKLKRGVGSINQYDFWHGFRSQPPSLRPRGFQVSAAGFLPSGFRRARLPVAGCCRVAPGFRQRGSSSRLPLQCFFFCRVSSRLPPPYVPPRFR